MKKDTMTINGICRKVGINPTEFNEVMRRIERVVIEENAQVISKVIGTFYRRDSKATTKTLNGVVYQVPARSCVQLRSPKFITDNVVCERDPLSAEKGNLVDNQTLTIRQSFPSFGVGTSFQLIMEVTEPGDIDGLAAASGHPFFRSQVHVVSTEGEVIDTSLFGVNDLLNGGFRFGYSDHQNVGVSLGDRFGLSIEVIGVLGPDIVECRVDRVLNDTVSVSSVATFFVCDLTAVFVTTAPATSLLFDLVNGVGLAPRAQVYDILV